MSRIWYLNVFQSISLHFITLYIHHMLHMFHTFHTFHTDPYGHRNWHPTPPTYGLPLTLSTKTLRPSIASWPLGHFSRTWATSTVLFPEALKKSPRKRWVGWMMLDGWMVMVDHLPLGWGFQSHDFEWVLNNSSLHSLASGLMTPKDKASSVATLQHPWHLQSHC